MDSREAELRARLARSRQELRRRAEVLAGSLESRLDLFEPVRRDPVGSVLAAASVGVMLGALGQWISNCADDGRSSRHDHGGSETAFSALAASLLPALAPLLVDLLRSRFAREGASPSAPDSAS